MESIFPKDMLATRDWELQALNAVIKLADRFKLERQTGILHNDLLAARSLFSIFYNTSTRTRTSFMAAMTQLGGETHTLNPAALQESIGEVIKDTAGVLARYGDAISVRHCFTTDKYGDSHNILKAYAEHSGVPVINMESDMFHPCQVLADWQTIRQNFGEDLKGKKITVSWAYGKYIRPVAVPQSLISMMTRLGMDVTLAHPEGFELDPDVIKEAEEAALKSGGKFRITNDMEDGMKDTQVIYAKNWGALKAMPDMEKAAEMQQPHKNWIVDEKKMALTSPDSIYMHCLPVDRGLEVEDSVIDGPHSRTMDQAENRLHVQKALLALLINNR